jgi:hypothetical protein
MNTTTKQSAAIAGAGAAACAVCCAGPILGVLAAIGLGTITGVLLFGAGGLIIAALGVALVVYTRRRRARRCVPINEPVPVELTMEPRQREPGGVSVDT